jgi:hypothetical protein
MRHRLADVVKTGCQVPGEAHSHLTASLFFFAFARFRDQRTLRVSFERTVLGWTFQTDSVSVRTAFTKGFNVGNIFT